MHAETIAIGSELLLGAIIDTNSAAIAQRLQSIGLPLYHSSAIGDDVDRIATAVLHGLARSDLVITTGGLGPTVDDMTREAVAQAVGQPLVFDEALLAQIEQRFARLNQTMADNNRRQAYRPEGAVPIENPVGTAPCFIVEQAGRIVVCLPGVPREMEYLMDHAVLPYLRQRFNLTGCIKSRAVKVAGVGESVVDQRVGDLEALANPTVGLNASAGFITIRITATADSEDAADRLIAPVEAGIRERLGDWVFGTDADSLESVVLAGLRQRGESLATIECGSGGRLAGRLAEADQAGGVFLGGRVLASSAAVELINLARQVAVEAGASWGLACAFGHHRGKAKLGVAIWGAAYQEHWQRGFAGHPGLAPEWSANVALNALRVAL